jgi:hypothetical protein
MAERGRPLLMWSYMGEVADVVVFHRGLHRVR